MTGVRSEFLRTMQSRGYVHQMTDEAGLDEALMKGPRTAYIGFDCTADSLHVGSLVQIMILRHLQRTGHKPVVLLGGGTTKIGDPSGRDATRQLITDEQIATNMAGIRRVFDNYLTFGDGPTDAVIVNNADWLDALEYVPFLREVGRHFTLNRMLTFESVKIRLEREQPLTFLEFNYMILQAYDFLELNKRHDCVLQLGGSDQWGNIINGIELTRRIAGKTAYGLTTPLITTADGGKMGKTARGAIWLNEERLPAYDFWQFWRNTQDADVGKFLRLFTDLPLDEIERLEALGGAEINDAKKILANEVTRLAHSEDAARQAAETARRTFEDKAAGGDLPTVEISSDRLTAGIGIIDAFLEAGLGQSRGELRRLLKQGGARVNGDKASNEDQMISASDLDSNGIIKLSAGKKRHALIKAI